MGAFIIYDSTGAIAGTFVYSCPGATALSVMKANTPSGYQALAVAPGSPVLLNPTGFKVVSGSLQSV
jgi:hypothetical protein